MNREYNLANYMLTWIALICLSIGFVSGCDGVKGGTAKSVYIPHEKFEILNNNVRYLDRALANRVGVNATNAKRNPSGTLQVWATFQNHTDFSQYLEVRSVYLSRNKEILDGPTAWQRVHLPPNGIEKYTNNSIRHDQIDYYRIEARYCR